MKPDKKKKQRRVVSRETKYKRALEQIFKLSKNNPPLGSLITGTRSRTEIFGKFTVGMDKDLEKIYEIADAVLTPKWN